MCFRFSVITICLVCHLSVFYARRLRDYAAVFETVVSTSVDFFQVAFLCISVLLTVVSACTNSRHLRAVTDMQRMDRLLSEIHSSSQDHRTLRKIAIFLIFVNFIWFLVNWMPVCCTSVHVFDTLSSFVSVFNGFVFSVTDLHLMCYAMCLKHSISPVNELISKHIQAFPPKRAFKKCNNAKSLRLRDLRLLQEVCNNASVNRVLSSVFVKFTTALFDIFFLVQMTISVDFGAAWNAMMFSKIAWTISGLVFISWVCSSVSDEVSKHYLLGILFFYSFYYGLPNTACIMYILFHNTILPEK